MELNDQQYHLTVKAADHAQVQSLSSLLSASCCRPACVSPPFVLQVDFLVEATLQLNAVPDKAEVREILRSCGFVLEELTSDHVRVRGSFLKLQSVKALLEMHLKPPATVGVTPAPSLGPKMSSVVVSKHHTDVWDAKRGPLESQHQRASPSASTSSSLQDFPGTPEQTGSVGTGTACSPVDPDVFDYAKCLRKKDVDAILVSHDARVSVKAANDHYIIVLWGKNANVCMNKLKTLLDNLHKCLRTQEVPLKDLTPEGRRLAARIEESRNIYKSVLVQKRSASLHLIGPPGQSYELQQTLLGRAVDQSQRRGRRADREPRRRSSSLPPTSWNTDDGAGPAGSRTPDRRRLGGPAPT